MKDRIKIFIALLGVDIVGIAAGASKEVSANVQPFGNCIYCGTMTHVTCLRQNTYSYTTTCKDSSCKVKVYKSRSAEICKICGRYVAYYGEHECAESHSSCGKGYVSICTQGYWPIDPLKNKENILIYNVKRNRLINDGFFI